MFINTSQILIVKISTIVENKPGMAVETYHLDRRILNPETYFNSWTKTYFFVWLNMYICKILIPLNSLFVIQTKTMIMAFFNYWLFPNHIEKN